MLPLPDFLLFCGEIAYETIRPIFFIIKIVFIEHLKFPLSVLAVY